MRVLLIRPVSTNFYQIIPNLGLGYLAAVARARGHHVDYLDCVKERLDQRGFARWLDGRPPYGLTGIQIFTNDFVSSRRMLETIKRRDPRTVTCAGGPHVAGLPGDTLARVGALDHAFVGEAEIGFGLLLDRLSGTTSATLGAIPSLAWRDEGRLRKNPTAVIEPIDACPRPAWDLMDPRTYPAAAHGSFTRQLPTAPMIMTRGCPFPCTYCAASVNTGKRIRYRALDDVLDEIDLLVRDYGVREIHFEDDNFTLKREPVVAFCEAMIRRGGGITFGLPNGVRLDTLDPELLSLMERAGFYSMSVGVETGSPRLLKVMKRHIGLHDMERQIRLIKTHSSIRVTAFLIMGYPSETLAEMEATIDYAMSLPVDRIHVSNFLALPGTPVFAQLLAEGALDLETIDWESYLDNRLSYSPDGVSHAQLRWMMKKGFFRFYARPRILRGLLGEIHSPSQLGVIARRAFDTFV